MDPYRRIESPHPVHRRMGRWQRRKVVEVLRVVGLVRADRRGDVVARSEDDQQGFVSDSVIESARRYDLPDPAEGHPRRNEHDHEGRGRTPLQALRVRGPAEHRRLGLGEVLQGDRR